MSFMSPESVGIHTFITDQRLAPVNIERNIKKNPMYPQNDRSRYESTPNIQRMSMSEVTFTLKAKPTRIPVRMISCINSRLFFNNDSLNPVKNTIKALILKKSNAGSSFISLV